MATLSSNQLRAVLYILMNIGSGTCIVFANKMVLSVYQFHFVYALTLIHTVTTMVGLHASLLSMCPRCCDVQGISDSDMDVEVRVSALSLHCEVLLMLSMLCCRWECGRLPALECISKKD